MNRLTKNEWRPFAARTALLMTVGMLSGLLLNAVRPDGVPYAEQSEVACEAGTTPVTELPPEEAATSCQNGRAVVVDVRPAEQYAQGHIPGAIHLPCRRDSLDEDIRGLLASANLILVYGESTADGRQVAESLANRDLPVSVLLGGYPHWESSGQACASGPCVDCEKQRHGDVAP